MQVDVEIPAVSKANVEYFRQAAYELEANHTYTAASVLMRIADEMEKQLPEEPIRPGVYYVDVIPGTNRPPWTGYYKWDGEVWRNGMGQLAKAIPTERRLFSVLKFIGTGEGQDD